MRARHEKRYGITGAKPVNTAGGVTMLKPKPSGLPMAGSEPEPAPVAGAMGNLRLDKQARGGRKWIAGAIKHPGALHKTLGVPQGQKIPEKKLEKAEHSSNPTTRRRAALAKTLKGFHK